MSAFHALTGVATTPPRSRPRPVSPTQRRVTALATGAIRTVLRVLLRLDVLGVRSRHPTPAQYRYLSVLPEPHYL
jgi:hypothetical protein